MHRHQRTAGLVLALIVAGVLARPAAQSGATPASPDLLKVDAVFSRWTAATPGCAVGASIGGRVVLRRAYGSADLEHDVMNTPDTIFEAGSVSKQFTAAAMLMLAREGKLSFDDPVRKYVPELPDYGAPLTIRHMLTHMSGLRDWGSVESIAGWPRGSRVYTHAHVLDIVSRQKFLNFVPGAQYSYSNTGYNLSAIIVSRVSGQSLADFTRDRIFVPLGMTHTSWRDDYTRIVKGRAIAYEQAGQTFRQDMPFENIYGNGGLLTTVGDLLIWNQNFVTPKIGGAAFVAEQQKVGVFNSGKPGTYALGLVVSTWRGQKELGHSGSTAGYRAHLVRYPDQDVSVAVLCNAAPAQATAYAHAVAEILMPGAFEPAPAPAAPRIPEQPLRPSATQLAALSGVYTSDEAETTFVLTVSGDTLLLHRRPDTDIRLVPTPTADVFQASGIGTVTFRRDPNGKVTSLSVGQDRVFDLSFIRLGVVQGPRQE
jgi:CubicO group peptidase (beta-lactamase class C family)